MVGFGPTIHDFFGAAQTKEDVDARDKHGHDGLGGCEMRDFTMLYRPNTLAARRTHPRIMPAAQNQEDRP